MRDSSVFFFGKKCSHALCFPLVITTFFNYIPCISLVQRYFDRPFSLSTWLKLLLRTLTRQVKRQIFLKLLRLALIKTRNRLLNRQNMQKSSKRRQVYLVNLLLLAAHVRKKYEKNRIQFRQPVCHEMQKMNEEQKFLVSERLDELSYGHFSYSF